MIKWKYKVQFVKYPVFAKEKDKLEITEDKLNRFGMEGWELIHMIPGSSSYGITLYLKRSY